MTGTDMVGVACSGAKCKQAATLQCPTCLSKGLAASYFCTQDCFKRNWAAHKQAHSNTQALHDPFPNFRYSGSVAASYPLSGARSVPASIDRPDYAEDGKPYGEIRENRMQTIAVNTDDMQARLRTTCGLAREVLDAACMAVVPGMTTDAIDELVHQACIARNCYPSPLNYYHFPKSVCTSVNEIICHGIPDKTVLRHGDIVNIDVTCYFNGVHGDLNETIFVIEPDAAKRAVLEKAMSADERSMFDRKRRLVEVTYGCLALALAYCGPGKLYREIGSIIETEAVRHKMSVVRSYCGHGIGALFHSAPNVPHYKANKATGIMRPGHCFTIEPMINLGACHDITWPDNWTAATKDGLPSAQFEQTILITETGAEILTNWKDNTPFFKKQHLVLSPSH